MGAVLRKASPQAGFVSAIAFFAAASYYVVYRELNLILEALLVLGVLAGALYVWGSGAALRGAVTSRQARRGSNSLVMVVIFVAIVGLVNFLAARHPVRWDLTETGEFSLAPQSIQVLENLEEPVHVIGFYTGASGGLRQQAEDMLKEYTARSDKVTVEMVDIDQKPTLAQQYQIRTEGLLFLSGDRRQEVMGSTQSDITNALLKVTGAESKTIAFVVGHGERAIDGFGDDAYSEAKSALEADTFTVTTVNLLVGPVGDDVDAVVLAAPQSPLAEQERQALRDYLKQGGKMFMLYDPLVDAQLDDILLDFGVSMGKDLIVDVERALYPDPGIPVVFEYGWSPITKDLGQTVFPGAAALGAPDTQAGTTTVTPLARTSSNSWTTKDPRDAQFKEGDTRGPLNIAVAIEAEVAPAAAPAEGGAGGQAEEKAGAKSRVVMVADSDFASNGFLNMASNRDFFVNSANWLTETEEMIAIRPKPPEDRSVFLTPTQSNMIWLTSIVLLPLLVLVAGGSVWWSRR